MLSERDILVKLLRRSFKHQSKPICKASRYVQNKVAQNVERKATAKEQRLLKCEETNVKTKLSATSMSFIVVKNLDGILNRMRLLINDFRHSRKIQDPGYHEIRGNVSLLVTNWHASFEQPATNSIFAIQNYSLS